MKKLKAFILGTVVLFDENPSIKSCYFDIINVFKPYGEEVAYTIRCLQSLIVVMGNTLFAMVG